MIINEGGITLNSTVAEMTIGENEDTSKSVAGILTFIVDTQVYGVEIHCVTDIIEIQPITLIPKLPSYIEGVINLRGKVVPVINVRERFQKEKIPYDERTCIVVIEIDDISVGIIVDRVCEVINATEDEITAPPDYKSVNSNRFIKNIVKTGEQVKLILDCHKLVLD